MQLEVRVVFRVKPENAPFMVAKIGSIDRLIQNVMHPLIDSIFRNQASESSASKSPAAVPNSAAPKAKAKPTTSSKPARPKPRRFA